MLLPFMQFFVLNGRMVKSGEYCNAYCSTVVSLLHLATNVCVCTNESLLFINDYLNIPGNESNLGYMSLYKKIYLSVISYKFFVFVLSCL